MNDSNGNRAGPPDQSAAAIAASSATVGVLEWFHPGEYQRVEEALADLKALGVTELRTGISWHDYTRDDGEAWYDWMVCRLVRQVRVLPCFCYTPVELGLQPKTSSPPRDPKAFADFVDVMITKYGKHFEWVELWNEPNNISEWDWTLDDRWLIFGQTIGGAAYWARHLGRKTVLGGMSPVDPGWLGLMFDRGVMDHIDVVGIHGFPGTWEFDWSDWSEPVEKVNRVLREHGCRAEVWITEACYSTWRHDHHGQIRAFLNAVRAPVQRVYWYSLRDLDPSLPTVEGFHSDDREYHFGMKRAGNQPKLLHRVWCGGGVEGVSRIGGLHGVNGRRRAAEERPVSLITGGSGFIGSNLADRLARAGKRVLVYDNLSREGVERNWAWLKETHGDRVEIHIEDVRNRYALREAVRRADEVFHFAAQVAVTTSLCDVDEDFEINVRGTLNLLEEARAAKDPPPILMTSTNKVYGDLGNLELRANGSRYEPVDPEVRRHGVSEEQRLDFHSPYGCSKGSADQYILDYARSFGLKTAVFRMSCIYGPHQFGTEDQGWVAHFLIQAIRGEPITIYGDGMQVRDVLFVEDLVDAFLLARHRIDRLAGQAFNIGGGVANTVSLLELIAMIGQLHGEEPAVFYEDWRTGDQRYYVSDVARFASAAGWKPRVGVRAGVGQLHQWLRENYEVSWPMATSAGERKVRVTI